YVNDAVERLTGYLGKDVIGKTPRMLQGPKTDRHELDRIKQALTQIQPVRAELINYTKAGQEIWLELDIVPLANETGSFTHWVAVERDITDRKRVALSLLANEERFRLVAKATETAVWEWDIAHNTQWWSDGLKEIFGHEVARENAMSTMWLGHVHPDDQARADASLLGMISGYEDSRQVQYRFRRADGSWAQVEDRAMVVRDRDGTALRILGAMTDISHRLELEERLQQAQKMDTVGQLTGGVAHDFNNLLTIILGNAEILQDALVDHPDLQRMAQVTIDAADRAAELTSRLLAFSRKQALQPRVLDVGQLMRGMDGLLRLTLPENIEIEIIHAGGLWKTEVDAGQLESAIINLALNARDAMPDGGHLTIEMANAALDDDYVASELDVKAGQYVMITVTDSGHGIPADIINRVFEPFFTTKEVGKGSGLGLSMVYGFVKQSGGHIRIYSEIGVGTTFKLYFRRSHAKEAQTQVNRVIRKVDGGTETILVLEDDMQVREYVTAQLKSLGYHVFEASDGPHALEILNQPTKIDLLFTDVIMPGIGGREVADSARLLAPHLKVLFTSGYTENSIVHNGRLDPGVDLLTKPYRRDQLAAKIRKVLDQK
ncbi:MAG: PAS domain S-box protein, partial [Candidatus Saccharibacteria bacterium]|nr:PAS domain S-box protein [Pseudorhodobacter sp.]